MDRFLSKVGPLEELAQKEGKKESRKNKHPILLEYLNIVAENINPHCFKCTNLLIANRSWERGAEGGIALAAINGRTGKSDRKNS